MKDLKLSELEYDALKEIANVGAGHASGALSKLIKRKIDLQIPEVKIEWIREPQIMQKNDEVIAIFSAVKNDELMGNFILALPWQCYLAFMKEIDKDGDVAKIRENEEDIKQLGYAVFDSYQAAFNQFLNFNVTYLDPSFVLSAQEEFIYHIYKEIEHINDYVMIISTEFIAEDSDIRGRFEMTLSADGLRILMGKIKERFGF